MNPIDSSIWLTSRPSIEIELRYSVASLLAEYAAAAGNVTVFTDERSAMRATEPALRVVDIAADVAGVPTLDSEDIRPGQALRAAARAGGFRRPCVLMDTNSFVGAGFGKTMETRMAPTPSRL